MSMLDAFFYKGFKGSKCNTLLKLSMPRIKLLRNRREIQIKQMRRDIAKLLEAGQEATARIRVEHIIREENMMAAQEILELFCELIAVRVPIIETQRECPLDLKEAISSLCFAAPRCADLPELQQVQMMFASKYGKEFVSAATGLMPDCGVNRQLIELLSVRAPAPEKKLELLKEIAEEHNLDWNPEATETAFFKQPEDLLNGPTQFVSGSKLPLPKEKHDETAYSTTTSQGPKEQSDEEDFEVLDFPEVPKVSLRPNADAPSAPTAVSPFASNVDLEKMEKLSKHLGGKDNPLLMEQLESDSEDLEQERPVPSKYEPPNVVEKKQFLPFVSSPLVSSPATHTMKNNSPPCLSTTKNEMTVDLQDVLAAAHAAADSAERAAAAARSAASLAQRRITELINQKNDADIEAAFENPFPPENLNESAVKEKQHLDHVDSTGSSDAFLYSPDMSTFDTPKVDESAVKEKQHLDHVDSTGSSNAFLYSPDMPTFDTAKGDEDDPAFSNDHVLQHGFDNHQPQRLPSMDDDSYFSYPNLFSSQGSHHGPGPQSMTNSRSTDKL